ncbi:uncharacterized protein THITE_127653 [Thermothielavioides terrestris NRRL 8126]|uniref:Uncharacterized protein n=1 Tax=Thermothielavioides terrestris (strain ATCC 38088 / NRRL 8126) TaxID=578455 RepID=G2QSQ5_THETT|nr:uncharacterized protein THITE_127653 [Thermothielavioides terrestris NRRL 8126]AEO64338.1 hypothetical protein THITE_127653 [Thermothielavioides terrestris NRRL 8126]
MSLGSWERATRCCTGDWGWMGLSAECLGGQGGVVSISFSSLRPGSSFGTPTFLQLTTYKRARRRVPGYLFNDGFEILFSFLFFPPLNMFNRLTQYVHLIPDTHLATHLLICVPLISKLVRVGLGRVRIHQERTDRYIPPTVYLVPRRKEIGLVGGAD